MHRLKPVPHGKMGKAKKLNWRSAARRAAKRPMEISVSTAARIAKCSKDTVLRWIEEGAIEAWRISRRGWWRIDRASLSLYLEQQLGKKESENNANSARNSHAARSF